MTPFLVHGTSIPFTEPVTCNISVGSLTLMLRIYSITTLINMVFPASTGFGVIVAEVIAGWLVSSVTFLVTEVDLPAASVAVMTITFAPSASVICLLNAPPLFTVTAP